jgi:two-component system OmpR family response regulator
MANLKVFLVEDDEVYSMILAHKLNLIANFFVSTFETGEACLENLNLNPDIIVLDYDLPGISGLETLKKLKEINPAYRVIFLSGFDKPEIVQACIENGADEYIVKDKEVDVKVYRSVVRIMEEEKEKRKPGLLGGWLRKLKNN